LIQVAKRFYKRLIIGLFVLLLSLFGKLANGGINENTRISLTPAPVLRE
jgi:hypothetical protein